jgi:hypothetical protein
MNTSGKVLEGRTVYSLHYVFEQTRMNGNNTL